MFSVYTTGLHGCARVTSGIGSENNALELCRQMALRYLFAMNNLFGKQFAIEQAFILLVEQDYIGWQVTKPTDNDIVLSSWFVVEE